MGNVAVHEWGQPGPHPFKMWNVNVQERQTLPEQNIPLKKHLEFQADLV